MNHRDFSKVNKNKTVVDASIDIGNFTFTPYSDGVRIKSKNPSKPVEKGIGYVRTPEGMEINFDPKSFSINRELGSVDTINIEGVLLPDCIKRHMLNTQYGLSAKLSIVDEIYEYYKPKDKETLEEHIKRYSSEHPASVILEDVSRMIDNRYDELLKKERDEFMNYVKYGTTNPIKVPHEIKNVIFNDPATIVYWKDGTKTVVKVQEGDVFDPEKGLAMAFFKKMHGNTGNYNDIIHKWTKDYKPKYVYSSIWAEPEGLTIKGDNLTNPLSDAASELKRIADAASELKRIANTLEKRDAE